MTPAPSPVTARQRAKNIVDDLVGRRIGSTVTAFLVARLTQEIKSAEKAAREEERNNPIYGLSVIKALSGARQEGYTRGCVDAIHNSPMYEEGFRAGQESMRERAFSKIEPHGACCIECCKIGEEIRALPIEGDKA